MPKFQDSYDYGDKLSFLAEWFDYESALHKEFILNYFLCDSTVELFDKGLNRIYLKRSKCENVAFKDFYVGNTIRIYGRQIKIIDYADGRTTKFVGKSKEHTLAILKPSVLNRIGEILTHIESKQFQIAKMRMCQLTRAEAERLYESMKGDAFLPFVVDSITAGPAIALELVGDDAIERWKSVIGPTDPMEARKSAPQSLRALYGSEKATNGFHGAANYDTMLKECRFFFPQDLGKTRSSPQPPPKTTVQLSNSTCCVIKPHAIQDGKLGSILSAITESQQFCITALQMFYLSNANADEFLEVYKGVVSDFNSLLPSFLDGPCVALEISGTSKDANVHCEFRSFAGPSDSDVARQIRPHTLRARFGIDKYRNAVHCTDLPEDTQLELEYFFKILN